MPKFDRAAAEIYLDAVFGTTPGQVRLAVGRRGCFNDSGKYDHADWSEVGYAWPSERDMLLRETSTEVADGNDVYICPYLHPEGARRREKGAAIARTVAHTDDDAQTVDLEKVKALGGFVVGSGSPGHGHVYVKLAADPGPEEHERLCKALAIHLGGDPGKHNDNDLLRLPGTVNGKDGNPVTWMRQPVPITPTPGMLAQMLGVLQAAPGGPNPGDESESVAVQGNLAGSPPISEWPQWQRDRFLDLDPPDRSTHFHALVGGFRDLGFTQAQTTAWAGVWVDAAKYDKYRGRVSQEVARCWPKVAPKDPDAKGAAAEQTDEHAASASQAMTERLIRFADEHCEVFLSTDGRVYGCLTGQPGRAHSRAELVNEIKGRFHVKHGRWPDSKASAALADYLSVKARRAPVRQVPLRCAWDGRRLLVDMGDPAWSTLEIDADGWRLMDASPVSFRRSPITAAMPTPAEVADLDALWRLVPLAEDDRPLALAALICAWMTGIAQPIVFLNGAQDSGKTETARFLLSLVDPVTVDRGGSLPSREEDWKSRISAYRAILIDNASNITAGMSDTLCKIATGGEATTRALYTDDTAHHTQLLAPVWLTSIGVGALRGDLGSRLVRLMLEPITTDQRLALSDLRAAQDAARPGILRALLDLTVAILRRMPIVDRTGLDSRMTDFLIVLRCIDEELGTQGCKRLADIAAELAEDVLDADPVAQALLAGVADDGKPSSRPILGHVAPAELLRSLTYYAQGGERSSGWPRTPKILSEHLTRIAPALLSVYGITVERRRTNRRRYITIARNGHDE